MYLSHGHHNKKTNWNQIKTILSIYLLAYYCPKKAKKKKRERFQQPLRLIYTGVASLACCGLIITMSINGLFLTKLSLSSLKTLSCGMDLPPLAYFIIGNSWWSSLAAEKFRKKGYGTVSGSKVANFFSSFLLSKLPLFFCFVFNL